MITEKKESQMSLLNKLEEHCGGAVATANLLGVDYTGSYCRWKADTKPMPKYIRSSVVAHLALFQTRNVYLKGFIDP